mmetsp:Transcript_10082/g.25258  ORF Transcript_10082/g.25258 Transcript_10082/m.25258 type:complete len:591 (-) Transcript_10082:52-1824(-)
MLDFKDLAERDLEVDDSDDDFPGFGKASVPAALLQKNDAIAAAAAIDGVSSQTPSSINRQMRVLVLHGRQSNENLVAFQLSGFKSALGKDVDIRYLEGDHVWSYREGVDTHDADQMTVSLAKGKPFKLWFDHTTDDNRDRIDFFKQQDPYVKVTYNGADKAVDKVLKYLEDEGPVDVIVTLFEGSIVVHLAIARLISQGSPIPWRLSVFFGGTCIRDDTLAAPLASRKVNHPTVHVFGKADEYYFYQRTAATRTAAEDYYQQPVILEHQEGHMLPSPGNPKSKEIYERIVAEMQYRCGLTPNAPQKVVRPPKPSSWAIRDLNVMAPRKVRVLCLCGGHSCSAVIKFQTQQLKNALGKDATEFVYLEGSKDWTWYEGEPTISEMEEKIAKGAQLKNWYMDTCHVKDKTKEYESNAKRQFDPDTWVQYHDVQGAVDHLRNFIMTEGPFDVLVGFSQGCIMAHLFMAYFRKDAPGGLEKYPKRWQHAIHSADQMPWRISVFFAGMHVRDKDYFHLFENKLDHPTIQVFGKLDEYYDYGRDGFGNKPQEEYYVDPIVMTHEQSHEFPTEMPRAKQIYDRVSAEVWRHCGGRPEV